MKPCSFDGCGKPARSAGFCNGHYRQHREGEKLRPLQVQYHGLSEYDRFFKRVVVEGEHQCWNWTGARLNRAGKDWHGEWRNAAGEIELVHRAAWRMMRSAIPEGKSVLHKCDNPLCCNPEHLFIGTQADNVADMWSKGRARPGVSIGEQHGNAKVTADQVVAIRKSASSDLVLSREYGVSRACIFDIRRRKVWKHID